MNAGYLVGARVHSRAVGPLGLATAAQIAVMSLWHLPAATTAALGHDGVHWLMHASFLLAGLWFRAAVWQRVREPMFGIGPALVAMVAVMMSMGSIGALLTFSRRARYPVYAERAPLLGLEVLADQQLAGLIMWVPASVPYLLGGMWLLQRGLQRAQRRQPDAASGDERGLRSHGPHARARDKPWARPGRDGPLQCDPCRHLPRPTPARRTPASRRPCSPAC